MGWGRWFLLGDWGQQMDIQEQKQEIEELRQQLNDSYVNSRDATVSRAGWPDWRLK
jgi:ATP-dependent protease ClpP protease subunit